MQVDGAFCTPFVPQDKPEDEVAVKWDENNGEYTLLARNGQAQELLHEDGTWRKPTPDALALAWGTVKSMNRRVLEGRNRRNKV